MKEGTVHIIYRRIIILVISFVCLVPPGLKAQYNENLIKAAYIERITRFIEWPSGERNKDNNTFKIGVYDETEFLQILSDVFRDKPIKSKKVSVISVSSPEQMAGCNLCYISAKAKPVLSTFISHANNNGVLLISETKDFSKAGVHINFYLEDEKLKFEINEKSVDLAGFKVSYLLMQNARITQ